ncbi:hypothetical protein COO07_29640 [Bacillus pseudomycoides]|nr:hypothetical protein COO07_29640 [Bacillus pseudomycoides]
MLFILLIIVGAACFC